ncbi:hypothetical protein [Nocardia wallacei]|uniref:hypothetical protein n=1 Tax=Nocardia wallacei TaxID=480035 RepID=UPI002458BA25|nr:hypothetical protein [Nocardia wallacei]
MQQQPQPPQLQIDPAAMAAYQSAAADVAALLNSAAQTATGAADLDALTTDLGDVGAEFAKKFVAALGAHVDALTTASALTAHYGEELQRLTRTTGEVDSGAAAALEAAGTELRI